ncbi:ROK family glucokinase [Janibacter sp. G56]|uniref:ROK family glucokinase n=1 Tax=Janibacter sp. G56 TaxID=3418717 RepID=UPI003CFFC694
MSLAIGVDIGGTKVAAGVVDETGRVHDRSRLDTPERSQSPAVVEETLLRTVAPLLERHPDVVAVGVGAAGFVDAERGTVVFAPHLSWRDEPLQHALEERLEVPVLVDNDANAALWAESRFGAARGADHVVMITLGTGIGGAMLIGGSLVRGRYGLAGEFGHMQVVPGGLRCECGNRGCWEQYSSGNALVREAQSLVSARSPMAADLLARTGNDPHQLTGPLVTEAAQAGDATAIELFGEIGHWLGVGLANLAAALDPATFVIGGGVSAAGELLLAPARRTYATQLSGRGHRALADVVVAELGNEAGLIGAADLARRHALHEGGPA